MESRALQKKPLPTGTSVWFSDLCKFAVHRRYIPLYISYFCYWGAFGLTFPLIPVFLQSLGITPGEIAVFSFFGQICAFCSRLFVAILADRVGYHKLFTASCLVLADIFFVVLLNVPPRVADHAILSNATTSGPLAAIAANMTTQSPAKSSIWSLFEWRSDASLWIAFLVRTLAYTSFNPVNSLTDAMSFSVIARVQGLNLNAAPNAVVSTQNAADQNQEQQNCQTNLSKGSSQPPIVEMYHKPSSDSGISSEPQQKISAYLEAEKASALSKGSSQPPIVEMYDKPTIDSGISSEPQQKSAADLAAEKAAAQRMRVRAYGLLRGFGALGYIVMSGTAALVTRLLVPDLPITTTVKYSVIIGGMLWLTDAVAILFFRTQHISPGPNLLHNIGKFVRQIRVVKILVLLYVEATFYGIIWGNLFIYFKQIGGTSATFYTSIFSFTISELIIVSCFAHILIARLGFGGAHLLVLGAYLVRFVGYALIPGIWWNVPFDMLQGFTYGLQGVCMSCQMAVIAPPSMLASALGLAQGVYFELGFAFGYLLGGLGLQILGARLLFWCCAALSALALVAFGGLQFWDVVHQRRSATKVSTPLHQ